MALLAKEPRSFVTVETNAPAQNGIRVILLDDQTVVRAGMRMLLESWPGIQVIGDAGRSADALSQIAELRPDIVLLDLDSGGNGDALEFLRQARLIVADGRIIVLTSTHDSKVSLGAVRLGATGVILKVKAVEELRKAIHRVHAGELWLDRTSTTRIIIEISKNRDGEKLDRASAKLESLTQREREVAMLVCEGLQNEEIAERLFISETTVRHHLTSIFNKLEISNRFELIIFHYRKKAVSPALTGTGSTTL